MHYLGWRECISIPYTLAVIFADCLDRGLCVPAWHYAGLVLAMTGVCLTDRQTGVCLSVCYKPVLYQNGWTDWAGLWHKGFLGPILHCALRKFWYLHMSGYFTVELCPKLWTQKFSLEHIDSPVSFFPGFYVQEIIKLFKKAHYNRVV